MYVNLNEHKPKFIDFPDPGRSGIVTNHTIVINWNVIVTHHWSIYQVFVPTAHELRYPVKPHLVHGDNPHDGEA